MVAKEKIIGAISENEWKWWEEGILILENKYGS